ncbi:MAG: 23S rRNA (guanosine(2251)-2'-O)-methyltransferase RlmB [Pseudomonadota bacterium]
MSRATWLAGINAAEHVLRTQPERIKRVLLDERSSNPRLEQLRERAIEAQLAIESRRIFDLDRLVPDTRHQGVVLELNGSWTLDEGALLTLVEKRLLAGESVLLLALDQVTDPHNLGACLRSAAAHGVDALIMARSGSAELTPAARKVASGGAEVVPIVRVNSLAKCCERLARIDVRLVAADGDADLTLYECDLAGPVVIVLGAEHAGVSPEISRRAAQRVAIPIEPVIESLNVSVATGVVLFEARRQRFLASTRPSG